MKLDPLCVWWVLSTVEHRCAGAALAKASGGVGWCAMSAVGDRSLMIGCCLHGLMTACCMVGWLLFAWLLAGWMVHVYIAWCLHSRLVGA